MSTRTFFDRLEGFGYPLIRVMTGLMLMPHGAQKLFGWFGGYGLEETGQFFATNLGMTPGYFWHWSPASSSSSAAWRSCSAC